jgi:glutamate carboxypeptidase
MQTQNSITTQNALFSNIKNNFPHFFEREKQKLFAFFKNIVEINTYSYNEYGIEKCLDIFANEVPISLEIQKIGRNLVISNSNKKDPILLMGHIDTVFPEEMGFHDYRESGDIIYGPGVFDMKGGLLIALFSLKYLEELKILKDISVVFIVNSDEEIGSINSKDLIINYSKKAVFGLVFEGAGPNGEVVVGRKGKIGVKIEIRGKSSHAAFILKNKPSAILEMAHKIIEIEALNNEKEEISANIGKIEGGLGPNTVPDYCCCLADFRFSKQTQKKLIEEKIKNICNRSFIPGVKCFYKITSTRPCMEEKNNITLYNLIKKAADYIGVSLNPEIRPGVSDANFISITGTPVIDGLGPIGGKDHSIDEYIIKSSIPKRILLTALSIATGFKEYA